MEIIDAVWTFIKEQKNLLTRSLISGAIVLGAFFTPIASVFRVFILIAVIGFNVVRLNQTKNYISMED